MAIRMRFKPAEREVFVVGATVEWLDVTRWRAGVVTGEIRKTIDGSQVLPIVDRGPTTRTITTGQYVEVPAGHVRAVAA